MKARKMRLQRDFQTLSGLGTSMMGYAAFASFMVVGVALTLSSCAVPAQSHMSDAQSQSSAVALDTAVRQRPVAFLDRTGWGADSAQLASLRRLGAAQFLEAQISPPTDPRLPTAVAQQLAALDINQPLEVLIPPLIRDEQSLRMAKRENQTQGAAHTESQFKAINQHKSDLTQQAMAQQLLLAVYSSNQLQQRLSWFWLNHFNVFREGNIGPMMGDYMQRVIAPHALGHFRDLLQATMFSPQMLLYLNNAQNARGHINENYAREVMELHTLGVGNGYTQADVTNLARVLTGLGVDLANRPVRVLSALRDEVWQRGLVVFNPARHDPDPKVVLGHTLQGRGLNEVEQVITLLADDPATARHVSFELVQYFVADSPQPVLVDAMVRTWSRTHGDIAAVLHTLFFSPQFTQSLAQPQFKDPMRYVLSAVRASYEGRIIVNTGPMIGMLNKLGEPLYGRQTPDGYPMNRAAWDGPGQLTARFEVARQIAAGAPMLFVPPQPPTEGMTGTMGMSAHAPDNTQRTAPRAEPPVLAESGVFMASEPLLSQTTRRSLAQADNRVLWNAMWLSSPEFMNN